MCLLYRRPGERRKAKGEGRRPFLAPGARRPAPVGAALVLFLIAIPPTIGAAPAAPAKDLRVCADPNNLPFSNSRGEGFENKIAELIARDLGARLRYAWWAQRRGFLRNTLKAGLCDLVPGLPAQTEQALTTRPYYRSTYVFVSRKDRGLEIRSLDDPRLTRLRVGVQLAGKDSSNTPPAHALSRRRIVSNVVGYTLYGDYGEPNPPARIVDAVARGDIDVAIVWGPLAGFFASRENVPLTLAPVTPAFDPPAFPFVYEIAMGVRRSDRALRDRVDGILARRRAEIDRILRRFGVPLVAAGKRAGL